MDYERLFAVADAARARGRLADEDLAFVRDTAPADLAAFPQMDLPKSVKHPAGFTVTGAPVGTFARSALLVAGRKALGDRYAGDPFYERVETDFAMHIMRSHFHRGFPKGTHCCAQCTLAVLPVLEAGAIRYFDCEPLAQSVRHLITAQEWRFTSPPNAKMLAWALGG